MPENAIENPFAMIDIGSTFDMDKGVFTRPVFDEAITAMSPTSAGRISLSGNSEYVYDDNMNQGSMAVSGSYGANGISKVSGSLKAYVGRTHSDTSNTLSISGNIVKCAGIEYVDFDSINIAELIASLKQNVKSDLMKVLDTYLAAKQAMGQDDEDLQNDAMAAWVTASDHFKRANGTAVVIGVLWGGWGAVTLTLETGEHETRWKGGGEGNFTYEGTGASVSVSAAFGHSEDHRDANANASVVGRWNGDCVADRVNAWQSSLETLATKGISELAKSDFTKGADFPKPVEAPKIPALRKPKKESSDAIADKIKDIKDLDGLKAFSHASAYDKYKANGGKKSLRKYLEDADKANKVKFPTGAVSPRTKLVDDPDEFDGIADLFSGDDQTGGAVGNAGDNVAGAFRIGAEAGMGAVAAADPSSAKDPAPPPAKRASKAPEYEPMGIWLTQWSALFPWLVSGQDNRVPKSALPTSLLQFRTMHQDFITLFRLYRRVDAEGFSVVKREGGNDVESEDFDLRAIADSFSAAISSCEDFITAKLSNETGPKTRQLISAFIDERMDRLTSDARKVYELYDSTELFRKCELGGGVVVRRKQSEAIGDSVMGSVTSQIIRFDKCFFEGLKGNDNFDAFRKFAKAWPIPLPDGKIVMWFSQVAHDLDFSLKGALLCHLNKLPYGVTWYECYRVGTGRDHREFGDPIEFEIDLKNNCFKGLSWFKDDFVFWDIFPIPFSAAYRQKDWRGCALATGLGALPDQLAKLKTDLEGKPAWNFEHEAWKDTNLSADGMKDFAIQLPLVPKTYTGLVDEPRNVMD